MDAAPGIGAHLANPPIGVRRHDHDPVGQAVAQALEQLEAAMREPAPPDPSQVDQGRWPQVADLEHQWHPVAAGENDATDAHEQVR